MAETTRPRVLSLSGLRVSAGSPAGRRPDDWKKDGSHRQFMEQVAMVLNAPVKGIWKGTRGNGGGTMAHPAAKCCPR